MKVKGFQIAPLFKWSLYLSLGLLFLSGIAWLILHYFFTTETEFGTAPSPFEHTVLAIHGVAVPVFLVVFGTLFPTHIQRAFKARQNFLSGMFFIATLFILIASGYALYYSGNEANRSIASTTHSVIGILIVPFLLLHMTIGRKALAKLTEES